MTTGRRGRFISLEGGEGVGKTTQRAALAAWLQSRGLEVVVTREPGGSRGAEAIRQLLLTGENDRWSPRAEALLFAAARSDHVEKTILPALEAGRWVLSDRFIDSSLAYQGGGLALGVEAVRALHQFGSKGFMPDRTLLLSLEAGKGTSRARSRDHGADDRIGGRAASFHAAVDQAFLEIAANEPERVRIVDAGGQVGDVTRRLIVEIEDLL